MNNHHVIEEGDQEAAIEAFLVAHEGHTQEVEVQQGTWSIYCPRIIPQSDVAGVHLTDYPVTGTGILIHRISGGKIQEAWAEEHLRGIQGTAELVAGN